MVLADPARDVRDEIAAASGVPESDDKVWFHKLAAAVVEPERCVGCGGCIAACPSGSIAVAEDGRPTLIRMCTGCSFCWDLCPMAGLRWERLAALEGAGADDGAGSVRAPYAARALQPAAGAQDGGVVTALLVSLLEQGRIDAALVTRRRDAFHGEPVLATTPEEIRAAAGSVYEQSFPLELLSRPLPDGVRTVAFVGTPCQVNALRALQHSPWRYRAPTAGAVTLAVALFCTRSFDAGRLAAVVDSRGLASDGVEQIDVRSGMLSARIPGEGYRPVAKVTELGDAGLRGCDECADFSGRLADLSVGNVGSARGQTTVLVRTEAGEAAWEAARGALEVEALAGVDAVATEDERNRRRSLSNLARSFSPDAPLRVRYSEHVAAYADTDRAAVAPPHFRSHHYQESC